MSKKNKKAKLGTCDNDRNPHPKRKSDDQCADLCRNWVKLGKQTKVEPIIASGGWCSPTEPLYDFFELPTFRAQRGGVDFNVVTEPESMSQIGGGDFIMGVSVSRLFHVASLIAFGGAVLGSTLFGHGGLELVSAGLFLHVGADLAEDVLAG